MIRICVSRLLIVLGLLWTTAIAQTDSLQATEPPVRLPEMPDGWSTFAETLIELEDRREQLSFQTGNFHQTLSDEWVKACSNELFYAKATVEKLFANEELLFLCYEWFRPVLKVLWSRASYDTRQSYLELVQSADLYLAKFNTDREKHFLKACQNDPNLGKASFLQYGPLDLWNGREYDPRRKHPRGIQNRKMEAFLYRRISAGVPIKNLKSFLQKLKSDFQLPVSGDISTHFANDHLREVVSFRDGLPDGNWETYYETGAVKISGNFSKGKRTGEWVESTPEGEIYRKIQYKENQYHGDVRYYVNGYLQLTEHYQEGVQIGTTRHDEKGNALETRLFRENRHWVDTKVLFLVCA